MTRRFPIVLGLLILGACSADSTTALDRSPVSLAIGSIAIQAGDSLIAPITVTEDSASRAPKAGEIAISSSDTTVIAIAPSGALLAVGDGTASITASWVAATGITASQAVVVSSEHLTGVSLSGAVEAGAGRHCRDFGDRADQQRQNHCPSGERDDHEP